MFAPPTTIYTHGPGLREQNKLLLYKHLKLTLLVFVTQKNFEFLKLITKLRICDHNIVIKFG